MTHDPIPAAAQALLQELDAAMKSPRGDYYQGDVADPHRAQHIVERHLALALTAQAHAECHPAALCDGPEQRRAGALEEAAKHADCCVDREELAEQAQKIKTLQLEADIGAMMLTRILAGLEMEQFVKAKGGASVQDVLKRVEEIEREARSATWEAAAKIAEQRESPWSTEHPTEAFLSKVEQIVLQAALTTPRGDDNEPEHTIAQAIFDFLSTGQTAEDKLFGERPLSAEIRAAAQGGIDG